MHENFRVFGDYLVVVLYNINMTTDQHKIRMVRLSEAELGEIVEGNSFRFYASMVVIFVICATAAIVLALYVAQMLAGPRF